MDNTTPNVYLLQSVALVGTYFIQIGLGIEMISSTVIIGALAGNSRDKNETLTLTSEEQSWFGKVHDKYHLCRTG